MIPRLALMPILFTVNLHGQIWNGLKEKLATVAGLEEPISGLKDHPLTLRIQSGVCLRMVKS